MSSTFLFHDLRNIKKLPDKVLGAGASGTCYVGIDISSGGKLYAVKEIPLENSNSDNENDADTPTTSQKLSLAKKLRNEIAICSSIPPHPNVVTYYGSRLSQICNNPFGFDLPSNSVSQNHHHHSDEHHHDSASSSSCLDIIMEYCPGGSVSSVLRSLNSSHSSSSKQILFPESLTKRYMADLLLGVDHLHNVAHVVHRDLKGDNLLLDLNGENAKVCDYGTATKRFASSNNNNNRKNNNVSTSSMSLLHQHQHNHILSPDSGGTNISTSAATTISAAVTSKQSLLFNTIVGTASYTAPEVASAEYGGGQNSNDEEGENENENDQTKNSSSSCYSSAADIWSIGCCAFEFLTGNPPCYGMDPSNQFAIFFAIATNEELRPDLNDPNQVPDEDLRLNKISDEAKDFVMNCCCVRDPKKRKRIEELLQHPWVKKEVDEKKAKIEMDIKNKKMLLMMMMNGTTNRPGSAGGVQVATSTKNLGLSLSMEDDEKRTTKTTSSTTVKTTTVDSANDAQDDDEDEDIQTKTFHSLTSTTTNLMKTTTNSGGDGFLMPNGAFVDF